MAGEASGDAYGADLTEALKNFQPGTIVKGMGGEKMKAAGVDILVDSTELGVVGFVEVLKHLPTFLKLFKGLVQRAAEERPDAVVLIDYPGFNLRFAKKMNELGIKVVYYVSPQVWAWGKKRIKTIPHIVDKMMVIFPFETDVYQTDLMETVFVGHPLVGILNKRRIADERSKDTVLLLPGSRSSELNRLLAPMVKTAVELYKKQPHLKLVISTPRERVRTMVQEKLDSMNVDLPLQITCGDTEEWLQKATCGLAASGTVTVQAAILGLPLVVGYRLSPMSYLISKMLVDIPYFTMVNLVTNRRVYEEFLQGDVCPAVLVPALEKILPEGERRKEVEEGMIEMIQKLKSGQDVAANAAAEVFKTISESPQIPTKL